MKFFIKFLFLIFVLAVVTSVVFCEHAANEELPAWTKKVGSRSQPRKDRIFPVSKFGAIANSTSSQTKSIQQAIDACSKSGGGIVTFEKGDYVTGALFIRSNVNLKVDDGVTLLASQDEAEYPKIATRVAGIEMPWPAALINVNFAKNAKISGGGTIDGRGQKWWDKYWNLRKEYEPKGLRWASDYDAERVRLLVVWRSSDVTIENLSLKRSGFWTVQVAYSSYVTVDGVKISDNGGPSTDGVDIDSSDHVLIQNCDIDNNDDDICLKSGRDFDGLRVNRPTEYVLIRHNMIRRGGGVVAFGSETSGGIRHIVAVDNRANGTKEGIRFKSAKTRGGYVKDVLIRGLKMENVPLPFTFTLNWNPSYSYATIPKELKDVPTYWTVLNTPVLPVDRGYCDFNNIRIENVEVVGATKIFSAAGLPDKLIRNVRFSDISAVGMEAGSIEYAKDWQMKNVSLKTKSGEKVKITNSESVDEPKVEKLP